MKVIFKEGVVDCRKDQKQNQKSRGLVSTLGIQQKSSLGLIETSSYLGLIEIRIFKLTFAMIDLFIPFFQWMANLVLGKHTRHNVAATVEEESGFDRDFVTIQNQHMEGKVVPGLLFKL